MNARSVRILFLKDLFLSRWALFGYLVAGLASAVVSCLPGETTNFVGFILIITVAIAAGIHLIGSLLLAESMDQTRTFVLSLPVSLLDYSLAKIGVVLTAFLIPWSAMLALLVICNAVIPGAKQGMIAVLPVIFLFLLGTFSLQLVTAVLTGSIGWTVSMVVLGNVLLNVFLKNFFEHPVIEALTKSPTLSWPPLVLQIMAVEFAVVVAALAIALFVQTRQRDLV